MSTVSNLGTHISALFLAASICAAGRTARAIPTLAAAAGQLSPGVRASLLGGSPAPAVVLTDGAPGWTMVPTTALDGLPLRPQALSLGSTMVPTLDRSRAAIGATEVTQREGLTGRGVVLGLVDTGVDITHDDLRAPDGTTRVAWLLDYGHPPVGIHPDLEARYALTLEGVPAGAVYNHDDLDALLQGQGITDLPTDTVGHGTYVASIAAGNGRATGMGFPPGRYVGIAPEATVVAVRAVSRGVATGHAEITDAALVAGVTFALDRAAALGMPVVINLSEGTQLGAHDGDAVLERALATLAGHGAVPGRALVVAAGNDGARPVHARAEILPGDPEALDLTVPAGAAGGATDVVGVSLAFDQALSVAVRAPDGEETPYVPSGGAQGYALSGGVVSVANTTDGPSPETGALDATVLFAAGGDTGRARVGGTWTILVRGAGRVDGWVFLGASSGFLPPHATPETTVAIPATSTDVVAVGAMTTRAAWTDGRGGTLSTDGTNGSVAVFSARGPDRRGVLRPDLLAPGDLVVGALSHQGRGAGGALADVTLWADDGEHAAGRGTSSAAPHVAGAMALLLQAIPTLTQNDLLAALAGSARGASVNPRSRWNPAEAWGMINLPAALSLARSLGAPVTVDPVASTVFAATDRLAPEETVDVGCRLITAGGLPATGSHTVALRVSTGRVTDARDHGGGRWLARYTARGTQPGDVVTLTATVDNLTLSPRDLRVMRDPTLTGRWGTSGGCSTVRTRVPTRASGGWWVLVFSARARGARRGTRRVRGADRARSPRRPGPRRPPPAG